MKKQNAFQKITIHEYGFFAAGHLFITTTFARHCILDPVLSVG